ncbi:hypothetical protein ACTG4Q_20905 [Bradyrhizobium denitrificans]
MVKVWIVEGVHHVVPGRIVKVCATEELAELEAVTLVDIIRADADLPADATADDWKAKLDEAREVLDDVCNHEEEYSPPFVEITDHEVIE